LVGQLVLVLCCIMLVWPTKPNQTGRQAGRQTGRQTDRARPPDMFGLTPIHIIRTHAPAALRRACGEHQETGRQTDRQPDRQTDRQTASQVAPSTSIHPSIHPYTQSYGLTHRRPCEEHVGHVSVARHNLQPVHRLGVAHHLERGGKGRGLLGGGWVREGGVEVLGIGIMLPTTSSVDLRGCW
jgi:hypothetical protein